MAIQGLKNRLASCASSVLWTGVLLSAATPASAVILVSDDPVLYWNQVLSTGLAGSPTVTSRGFAMVDVALYEAVNVTSGTPQTRYLEGLTTFGGDTRAAASVAAHDVLVKLNPAKTLEFDAALAASLALVPDGGAKTDGIATGAAIAAATIALRTGDGSTAVVPYSPTGLPGDWAPTPPGFAPGALPQWSGVDPWLIGSSDQFRPGAPPALGSAEYAAALNEVKAIGAIGSATRTADQSAAAKFWEGAAGTGFWIQAGLGAAQAQGLTTLENASLFGLLSTTVADAVISVWDAKYYYDFWRPVTAIQQADLDGNAATVADAGWESYIAAPPHPSYISGHSGVAGAAATVLSSFLGDSNPFCLTAGLNTRCFTGYDAAMTDAASSRLWGGIHWSFDNAAGLDVGQSVARYAIAGHAFDVVPEPSTWMMMILGFGLAGAALRRVRVRTIAA
nr:hypothetical protein [Phenylobacterium sp.]